MPITLSDIISHTRAEVDRSKHAEPLASLQSRVSDAPPPRNFFAAVTRPTRDAPTAVIAEIKRQSPSAGLIRPEYAGDGFRPEDIARRYHQAGAAAISCLTEQRFFGGHLSFVARIKESVPLPVLRKDFLIDPWQIWQSRAAGADAVLLMAECLTEGQLLDMLILAHELRLTTLLEVHGVESLMKVQRHVGFPLPAYALLGINNRDLNSMRVDLSHTLRLADLVDDPRVLVSESGIGSPHDLKRLRTVGVRIVLVGEHLMRDPDPGNALARLLNGDPA